MYIVTISLSNNFKQNTVELIAKTIFKLLIFRIRTYLGTYENKNLCRVVTYGISK